MATRKNNFNLERFERKHSKVARKAALTGLEWTIKILRKTAQTTIDSTLLLKKLTKRQRFKLSKVEPYLHKNEFNKIVSLVKQGKANIELKRFGWSFLISGKDLLPILHYLPPENRKFIFDNSEEKSDELFINEANKKLQKIFYKAAFEDFSERAWDAVPQYIAPTLVTSLQTKQAIALQLFCPRKFKILLKGGRAKNKILDSASEIDSSLIIVDVDKLPDAERKTILSAKKLLAFSKGKLGSLHDEFNLVLPIKKISLKKFTDLVESLVVQEININRNDIFFLKKYIKHAQKIKVQLPPHFANKIKKFAVKMERKRNVSKKTIEGLIQMIKASAAMELREQVETKDLLRVFRIYREIYWK